MIKRGTVCTNAWGYSVQVLGGPLTLSYAATADHADSGATWSFKIEEIPLDRLGFDRRIWVRLYTVRTIEYPGQRYRCGNVHLMHEPVLMDMNQRQEEVYSRQMVRRYAAGFYRDVVISACPNCDEEDMYFYEGDYICAWCREHEEEGNPLDFEATGW
jgi:hypothetical protein